MLQGILKRSLASNKCNWDGTIHDSCTRHESAVQAQYQDCQAIHNLGLHRKYFTDHLSLYPPGQNGCGKPCGILHFFLPPLSSPSLRSQLTTLPSITTPLPSMKATRERPSQFLKVSHTKGCCGWKLH